MIEGFVIYAVIYGLISYATSRRYPAMGQKIVLWIVLFVFTFPGFILALVFWSGLISAFSDNPVKP
jgi:hypothetical protein